MTIGTSKAQIEATGQKNEEEMEYFGLAGEHKHYDETVERKKKLARGLGLKLVYLLPSDLYPDRKIGEALSRFGIVI